ncbi:tachykinin-3 [Myotis daubentonii]|uniref:tachykinin-3 n=1 Tax=Myotis daubentonii TaxID=98922 RepID=UPI002873AB0C|nr:tachykinin-3 [Myotis daubentonii]XP_059537004.1 tachykinin-3 [Myotis daubentonii]
MRSALLLAASLALCLVLGAVCKEPQEQVVPRSDHKKVPSLGPLLNALTSHNPVSVVNELIKILSQARKDPKKRSFLQKRDMHDFFVGLMGKRSTQPGTPADVNQEGAPRSGSLQYPSPVE